MNDKDIANEWNESVPVHDEIVKILKSKARDPSQAIGIIAMALATISIEHLRDHESHDAQIGLFQNFGKCYFGALDEFSKARKQAPS